MMQYDPLSILTPFFFFLFFLFLLIEIGQKMRQCHPKTKSGKGEEVGGGPKMTIWAKYFILHDILLILEMLCICLKSKNPLS